LGGWQNKKKHNIQEKALHMVKQEVKKDANKATNVMCVRALQSYGYAKLSKSLFYGYLGVWGGGGGNKKKHNIQEKALHMVKQDVKQDVEKEVKTEVEDNSSDGECPREWRDSSDTCG
jgi:hypothetical protein